MTDQINKTDLAEWLETNPGEPWLVNVNASHLVVRNAVAVRSDRNAWLVIADEELEEAFDDAVERISPLVPANKPATNTAE